MPAPFDDMENLHNKNCTACDGNTDPFDIKEIHKYLKKINGWDVKSDEKKNFFLVKNYKFKNFVLSHKFIISIVNIAEREGHHPDIVFGWGYAKIKIFTHAIKGLTESDFILASKIDKII